MYFYGLVGFFPFLMIYAASSDFITMTISNRVSLALVAGFMVLALLVGLTSETIVLHLLTGVLCLSLTFAFFAAGWMGGGDAKLLAATAIWFGPSIELIEYLTIAAAYGGVLTIGLLYSRSMLAPVTGVVFVDRLLRKETGIPYGIALGLAGLTVYSHSPWMDFAINDLPR